MARSVYPIETRETLEWKGNDGQWYDSERKARQANARHAIEKLVEEHCYGGMDKDAIAEFIIDNLTALAPWLDDLNG